MSDEPTRNVFPKMLMLDQDSIDFLRDEALKRNPTKAGQREQSGVVRDALAFAKAHYPSFLVWIAIRSRIAE